MFLSRPLGPKFRVHFFQNFLGCSNLISFGPQFHCVFLTFLRINNFSARFGRGEGYSPLRPSFSPFFPSFFSLSFSFSLLGCSKSDFFCLQVPHDFHTELLFKKMFLGCPLFFVSFFVQIFFFHLSHFPLFFFLRLKVSNWTGKRGWVDLNNSLVRSTAACEVDCCKNAS